MFFFLIFPRVHQSEFNCQCRNIIVHYFRMNVGMALSQDDTMINNLLNDDVWYWWVISVATLCSFVGFVLACICSCRRHENKYCYPDIQFFWIIEERKFLENSPIFFVNVEGETQFLSSCIVIVYFLSFV